MREIGFELAVGDSVHLADQILTVIDIHGDDITFRLDHVAELTEGPIGDLAAPSASNLSARGQPR